jgi:hypothetical protein
VRRAALLVALALGVLVNAAVALPTRDGDPYVGPIAVQSQPVPMDPRDPGHTTIGAFTYAGGVALTSKQTEFLHGVSDLKVWPDGRLLAQSDVAYVFEGHVVLDAKGRLTGVTISRILPMKDEKGRRLFPQGQMEYDSEGVTELPNGDRLSSFEHHHRVLLYPKDGGPPRAAPFPPGVYELNGSFEALAADPAAAPDAYRLGLESTGQTWLCRVSAGCEATRPLDLEGLELSGFEMLPNGGMAYLTRNYVAGRGNVVRLVLIDRDGRKIDQMEIAPPLTVDDFEGIGVVPGPNGRLRFYLVSDDNFGIFGGKLTDQRTLFLAFDWAPPKKH